MFEFHVSRTAREKYHFNQSLFQFDGNVIFADLKAARDFAFNINEQRDVINQPEQAIRAGDINALGLIDEILHLVVSRYREQIDPQIWATALKHVSANLAESELEQALLQFIREFPPRAVFAGDMTPEEYLKTSTKDIPNRWIALEELLMLWVTNQNPAVAPFQELFDDTDLLETTAYKKLISELRSFFEDQPVFGPDDQDLITMLRSPAIEVPHSLAGQLAFIRDRWRDLIGEYLYRLLSSLDVLKEEQTKVFLSPGPTQVPSYDAFALDEENYSADSDWMTRTVMVAKNAYVWLYQLSKAYHREINRLDQIPDEELDKLASQGFNGLWLIGLWERSNASKRIKQLCGNPEAVASAYSLRNYAIAADLGGYEAYQGLRDRARQRGIRLASDMVPNHMGIDSDWLIEHPNWFIGLPHSPFPSYTFNGPDLSPNENVGIFIEDHYYDRSDAAVVFKRIDRRSGDTRFIYHGNDGTSMPWNDTAQLDYLQNEVREAVIQTILHVARMFPIIRFDAAMTLAKKHYQRLWFPKPGTGGAIPSRSEYGLTQAAFDAAFPKEFWREVVDRVAQEVPDTLLLAEAFWLMEGYFVRTLGMHRVYNSAFMNMLRNEENAKYRQLIKNTLTFDPQILKRYVNFMNNPDEETAVEQFGKGDKYFGICTLMSTMPGLPMFGHGQVEGYSEKYGMEYYRPYWDEEPDNALVQRHQHDIFPLLKRRDIFSGIRNFKLYDFITNEGLVDENVFAYSNSNGGDRALVVYHNHFGSVQGRIKSAATFLNKTTNRLEQASLHEALGLTPSPARFVMFRDIPTDMEYIRSSQAIRDQGLSVALDAYAYHVFMNFQELQDDETGQYARLAGLLNGSGVPSIDDALRELRMAPVLEPLGALVNPEMLRSVYQSRLTDQKAKLSQDLLQVQTNTFRAMIQSVNTYVNGHQDLDLIVREMTAGLEAILKLPVFAERYPFPGSKRYQAILDYIQTNLVSYPFVWYVLTLWNDLRLLGRVITTEPQFAEISRSWLDEWGISAHVQRTLEALGLDTGQAQSGVTILKLLISQQNWTNQIDEKTPLSLAKRWFASEEVRRFLNVNRFEDVLWFNQEAFESLLWWMMTVGLVQLISDPEKSLTEAFESLFQAYDLIQSILNAEINSEFQVEKLLAGLK
ncbi:MAG: alpha-amylase family glycosyl hydrolase [Chloroflexota bacterium]|nr:alpha-amylase family glycosyl hydrolase [Chloroflexota bacterium]